MSYFTAKNLHGYHFKLYPEIKEFVDFTKTIKDENFFDFLPHFKNLIESKFLARFLTTEAQKIDETFDYDFLNHDMVMEILHMPAYTLTLGKLEKSHLEQDNKLEISGTGSHMMYCNLGPGVLEVEIYTPPDDQVLECFDRNKIPILKNKFKQKPGEIITLRADKEIIKIVDTSDEAFQLYLSSTTIQGLIWHYEASTLQPLYATAGNAQASRIQCAILMLAEMGSKKAIPALKKLSSAKQHFLRWSAIKALLALHPSEGYKVLQKAAYDAHPHVRNAALSTLQIWPTLG